MRFVKGFLASEGIRGPYRSFEPSQSHYRGIWEFCQGVWGFVKILYNHLTNRYTAGLDDYKILYYQTL